MCLGAHWQANARGGRDRVTTSALSRILKQPNDYQTTSQFLVTGITHLLSEGNFYALALRNDRYEIDELHFLDSRAVQVRLTTMGDIFYVINGANPIIDYRAQFIPSFNDLPYLAVPARDILHVRLKAGRRSPQPLIGEPPLVAAYGDLALSEALQNHLTDLHLNDGRPSAVITTDLNLDQNQIMQLRDRWKEVARDLKNTPPILTNGLKLQTWNVPAKDAAVAEILKLSMDRICLAFRVPPQLLGLAGASLGSTTSLMEHWISGGLGYLIDTIETSFDKLFGLKGEPESYTEFSTDGLLRSNFQGRIEGLARAVQAGIFSPNEARNRESMDAVPYGDEPRVQAQVVPLSAAGAIPSAPSAPVTGATPAPSLEAVSDEAVRRRFLEAANRSRVLN
jgi:HK97 family phage portal protein